MAYKKLNACWIAVLFLIAASQLACGQDELTTDQANDKLRAVVRQLRQCKALDSPIQVSKGWIRMRTGPPTNIKSDLRNGEDGTDFYGVVEFTIETASGSRLFYPTEAEALADETNHVGMTEKHIHVYRISSSGVTLQARTLRKRYPNLGNDSGKTEADTGLFCWEKLQVDADSPEGSKNH